MSPLPPDDEQAEQLAAAIVAQHVPRIPDTGFATPRALQPFMPAPAEDEPDEEITDDDETLIEHLGDINLQAETIRLFRQTKKLLATVLKDVRTPANQKAQVANSLSSLLRALSTQQIELYNAERLRRLEAVIIRMVRDLPDEHAERFLAAYEAEVNVR